MAPQALRVMPEQTAQELSLLNAGLPVMRNIRHARPYFSQPERWVLQQFGWQPNDFLPEQFALCTAAVNENTLQPASTVTCSLHDTALTAAGQHSEEGSFVIRPDYPSTAAGVSPARISHARAAKTLPAGQRCPHAGPGLVLGPAGRWVAEVAQQWRPTAIAMRVLAQLWSIIVPTGSIARPQCGLFMQLHMLAYERPVNAFFVQTLGGLCAGCWEHARLHGRSPPVIPLVRVSVCASTAGQTSGLLWACWHRCSCSALLLAVPRAPLPALRSPGYCILRFLLVSLS